MRPREEPFARRPGRMSLGRRSTCGRGSAQGAGGGRVRLLARCDALGHVGDEGDAERLHALHEETVHGHGYQGGADGVVNPRVPISSILLARSGSSTLSRSSSFMQSTATVPVQILANAWS